MGYNDELSGQVVLDLETVAAPDCETFLDPARAPTNYKDPQKIAAYCEEKHAEQVAKAALEPDLCEVVAVGFLDPALSRALVYTRADNDEAYLLRLAWDAIEYRVVVGFNVLGFDLPVLIRRSQLLGLSIPSLNIDRYRTPHIDLLERLTFNGKLTYRSLSFYCRRFGIPCEDKVSGSDIAALVIMNDWTAIAAHCRADVDKTMALAQRLGWVHGQVMSAVSEVA